jgi:hypothetical protein
MMDVPELEQGVLAGYGCDTEGGYLVLDDLGGQRWQRRRCAVLGAQLTLQLMLPAASSSHPPRSPLVAESARDRWCSGRFDLGSGKGEPCPEQAQLREETFEQCLACRRATGFNPAFYFAPEVSPQQQARNREPHLVYLAHFGAGTFKVGMTHARRGIHRLLEQGARMGLLLARLPDAHQARALEERIARELGVAETVRAARKRHLLGAPFAPTIVRSELLAVAERVRVTAPSLPLQPELVELDRYYGGSELFANTMTDLSETSPPSISGRCVGMIGDVLITVQGGRHYMLSIGDLVCRRVRLSGREQPNRVIGQMSLLF